MIMIGALAGFHLRQEGFSGRFAGRFARAALIAAWTSRAAPSMSRLKSNWSVMLVEPSELEEVISSRPAMWPSSRSSGAATAEAIIVGLAPGKDALTPIVGKSIWGSGATGNCKYATMPARAMAAVSRAVPMGRRMNGAEMFMAPGQPED